jgi:parallel beta-helix repeat protein
MNMRTSIRTTALVALIAGGLLALSPGRALASHVSCGDTITTNTRLDSDLIDCPLWGIRIGADDITLDLAGHTIAQAPNLVEPRGGVVDRVGHRGVTIENGTVRGFDTGVFLINATSNRLRRLTVAGNDYDGIDLLQSEGNRVENNRVYGNGLETENNGILVFQSNHNEIRDNSLTDNGDVGLALPESSDNRVERNAIARNTEGIGTDHSDRNLFDRNHVSDNADEIIISGGHNTITNNHVIGAVGCPEGCGFGISLEGGPGNLIARNEVRRTLRDGIRIAAFQPELPTIDTIVRDNHVRNAAVDAYSVATEGDGPVGQTLFRRNTAIASGDDGFDVRSPASKLTSNLAVHNGDLGIDAVAGVLDGGHNRGFANGNPLQCINIAC